MSKYIECWAIVRIDTGEVARVRLTKSLADCSCQEMNGYGLHEYELRPATLTMPAPEPGGEHD